MNAAEKQFVKAVKVDLKEYGIRLVFCNVNFVRTPDMQCFGFFDEEQIRIAKKNSKWIEVLAHEYSHFIQWVTGSTLYRKSDKAAMIIEKWLHGKKYDSRTVHRAFNAIRAMERECEMITVEVIREYGLNVDIERYKQEANCYIYIHHLMEMHRKKLDHFKKDPMIPYYIRKMPSSFRASSHQTLPKKVEAILARCV
jgi:hypothetical protein